MMGLTPRQSDLLGFIQLHHSAGAVMPTYTEMMAFMDLKSKSGIHRILSALEERGYLVRMKFHNRAIELMDDSSACPHCGHPMGGTECRRASKASSISYSRTSSEPQRARG